ncbi:hypothetical protein FQR65_LT09658 [Abscondita terminalis]|nr:hypothetical protein FQR65_LT09658 [Abscondita terminalis]
MFVARAENRTLKTEAVDEYNTTTALDDTEPLCPIVQVCVYPKVLKNVKGVEKFILNIDNYQQKLCYEICKEGGPCRYSELFPSASQCIQRYTEKSLRVLDNNNVTYDTFHVPTTCQCFIRKSK